MPGLIAPGLDCTEAAVDKPYGRDLSESAPDEVLTDEPRFPRINARRADRGRTGRTLALESLERREAERERAGAVAAAD